jgi:propionyl-CoA synthetase
MDDPGSAACFDLLDRHVVQGHADSEALRDGTASWSYARLLEEVAAFGGVLRHCGVRPGDVVDVVLPESAELVVAVLACGRIGAEHRYAAGDAAVMVTDSTRPAPAESAAAVVLVKQRAEPHELREGRDYDWDVVMRAGRTDPAACEAGATLTPYDERTRALVGPLLERGTVQLG